MGGTCYTHEGIEKCIQNLNLENLMGRELGRSQNYDRMVFKWILEETDVMLRTGSNGRIWGTW
jgi:hypothetical protein